MVRGAIIALVVGCFSATPSQGLAQTFTWQPTSGGLYNTAANWLPAGGPPNAAGEVALYTGTTTQTLTLETSLTTSGHRIENGNITYQLNQTTQTMTAGAGLVVGAVTGQTGRFTILNGTLTGDMILGNTAASTGFFTIGQDAVFDAAAITTAVGSAANSNGTLTINNGGDYTGSAGLVIGAGAGSNGTVLASGAGSSLTTGGLTVADVGLGEVSVSSGATASVQATTLGNAVAGVGELSVSGVGSTLTTNNQNLTIGVNGTGTLSITAGGVITSNNVTRLAQIAGSAGAATVSGAGSAWNASTLAVGGSLGANGGTGTLLVEDGGAVNVAGNMEIRATAGTAVTLDGGTLTVGGNFTKNGALNLRDGTLHVFGTFDNGTSAAALTIDGADPADLPTLRLSGAGGALSEVTSITVGNLNRGALVVDLGRNINLAANNLLIGATATGDGAVTVTGASSTIATTGTISVGGNAASAQGAGSLTIGPNATVTTNFLLLFPQGTLSVNGGTLNTDKFNPNGGRANFTSGTVNFSAINTSLSAQTLDALLGTAHELGPNRTLGGGAGTLTIQSPLTVNGGSLRSGSAGSLENSSTLIVSGGVARADFLLTNVAGKTIVVSGTGDLSVGTSFANNGTLILSDNTIPVNVNSFTNSSTGVIRGRGSITTTGPGSTNFGLINGSDGDLEFAGPLTNGASTGLISGRDGVLRFTGGLTNAGSMAFSGGAMDVYGDVTQNVGGRITVTGGSVTTFYDDVTIAPGANNVQVSAVGAVQSSVVFLGSYNGGATGGGAAFIEGDHKPGNSPGAVSFGGDLFYGGGANLDVEIGGLARGAQYDAVDVVGDAVAAGRVNVSLVDLFVPSAGNSFEILRAAGGITGNFLLGTLPALSPSLKWSLNQTATSAFLNVVPNFLEADFNENGTVDAADLALWNAGFGTPAGATHMQGDANTDGAVDGADLLVWQKQLGTFSASAASSSTAAAVPEPASLLWSATTSLAVFASRRRRASMARHP